MEKTPFHYYTILLLLIFNSCQQPSPCDCESAIGVNNNDQVAEFLANLNMNETTDTEINEIVEKSVNRDLSDIKKDGVLRALVIYSSTSYFLYKGEPMGFEYELLERLADHLGLKLELIISSDLDSEFEVLNRGDVDLIAHGMTITNQRKWEVDFTEYLYLTRQVLVQRMPENHNEMQLGTLQKHVILDPIELISDTVSIRRNSAYYERILSLSNEIGGDIYVDTLDSHLSTDEIIKMVKEGQIKYTFADENLAKINASFYSNLKIDVPVSFSQRIAWVTRKKSPIFKKAVNDWILSVRKKTDYNVIYNKYFENTRNFGLRVKSDFYSLNDMQISKYDNLIKKYAAEIGWDWRLLASQVYQESKFDPLAKSWTGASGLMQIMPKTAKSLGVTNMNSPTQSIRGGTKYLSWLNDRFTNIPDSLTKIKFVLAAYNCGLGHVKDAQILAESKGLDPTLWTDQVEEMILALSYPNNFNKPMITHGYVRGIEPINYVNEIFERYDHYLQFIPLE
ncbi:MAG: membrane-bound lytic murein transglycosylase F [Marinoscillum sp.]|jgi:membrane-bound lytic murein transglycosylase F